jgi:hypothetical protein
MSSDRRLTLAVGATIAVLAALYLLRTAAPKASATAAASLPPARPTQLDQPYRFARPAPVRP